MTTPHKQPPHGHSKRPHPPSSARPIDASKDGEHGEGSYSATRGYQKSLKDYLTQADVEKDARDAAPDTAKEAKEMTDAEREARNRAASSNREKNKGK